MFGPVRLTTRTDILTAVPFLLGFIPSDSVVAILLDDKRVLAGARLDADADTDSLAPIVDLAVREHATAAILAVITDHERAGHAIGLTEYLTGQFTDAGIDTRHVLYAPALTAGATWIDVHTLDNGTLTDPANSAAATAFAVNGQVTATSRADLQARYRRATPVDMTGALAAANADNDRFITDTLADLFATVREHRPVTDRLAGAVNVLAAVPATRDAMLAAALIDPRAAAEAFTRIAAVSTTEARAHTLTLAGLFAHAAGHGAAAQCAYTAAEAHATATGTDNPTLLELARTAIDRALTPENITAMLRTATANTADRFGVELPD
ncbi:DUF4192 family protein [Skermania sp. ID1734]|uniref:DUF4192 family protein n=1 Tax=Skermania sp. ID1734 TaxID=2597516 RepID=UPI00163D9D1B|nr:DUF4192 family protein [Skermania sp. ID1734]